MKKILITGATGFIGSHLTELCVKKGYDVVAFDRYNTTYNLGHLENSEFKKDINFIFGDIRDYEKFYKSCRGIDAVIHLAYINGTKFFYKKPAEILEIGVKGITNVLDQRIQYHSSLGWKVIETTGPHDGQLVLDTETLLKKWLREEIGLVPDKQENWYTSNLEVKSLAELKEKSGIETSIF